MKFRTLLTAGATAAVAAAAALAAPTIASAANGPAPAVTAVQHASPPSFASATGAVHTGKVLGAAPAHGASFKKSAAVNVATAACTEPNCNLPYLHGPVQHTPHVYLVFWGPKWTTNTGTMNFVKSFFTGLGQTTKGDAWSTVVAQYTDATGHPTFSGSLVAGSWADTSAPPASVTPNDLGNEAVNALMHFNISDSDNADIVIASQHGTCFADISPGVTFAGNCGTPQTAPGDYCAYHDADLTSNPSIYLPWVNLPYQADAGFGCGQRFINNPGTNDGYSLTGGHELMEAITDPIGTGWFDNADTVSGGEVADKCAWGGSNWGGNDPKGNVTLATGKFAMQSLWSNAVSKCVMNSVSVATPGTQSVTLGRAVSLGVHTTLNGGSSSLTFTASGLPAGLSINKTTGVITGIPGVTAGTFTSHVTVGYNNGSQSISFGWHVSSVVGQVKGNASKCVDDSGGRTTAGNRIYIWTCNTGSGQKITFAANNELQVVGKCITSVSNRTVLESCTHSTSQQWTRLSNSEYVLKANGACLTEPSTNNGTQLTLTACRNIATQHWTLP